MATLGQLDYSLINAPMQRSRLLDDYAQTTNIRNAMDANNRANELQPLQKQSQQLNIQDAQERFKKLLSDNQEALTNASVTNRSTMANIIENADQNTYTPAVAIARQYGIGENELPSIYDPNKIQSFIKTYKDKDEAMRLLNAKGNKTGFGSGSVFKQKMEWGAVPENAQAVQGRLDKLLENQKIDQDTYDDWASQVQTGRAAFVSDELQKRGFAGASLLGQIDAKEQMISQTTDEKANAAAAVQGAKLPIDATKKLTSDIQTALRGAQSPAGRQQSKVDAAIHASSLIDSAKQTDGSYKINKALYTELIGTLAAMLGAGSNTSESQRNDLVQKSIGQDLAEKLQYFSNNPQATVPAGIIQQLSHMIDRQGEISENLKKEHINNIIDSYSSQLDSSNLAKFKNGKYGTSFTDYKAKLKSGNKTQKIGRFTVEVE